MGVLSGLQPEKVFQFFEEICGIPHGSGNVGQISEYLVCFARKRGLSYEQDEVKNVIIIKEASEGYEEQPPVIIQGHMDMVAVKKPDCDIDMQTEGLRLAVDGDRIYAEGTSLGGDDGIAVAYALALLDTEGLKHPRLEVVITVDEETGMDGARAIDLSRLQGHRMLNVDSEEEGIFWTSCAGGARVNNRLPVSRSLMSGVMYQLSVEGLLGGHSGAEIHKERGNSNCLMGRVLHALSSNGCVGLAELEGGLADNAIPRVTRALVVVNDAEQDTLQKVVRELEAALRQELAVKDPDVQIRMECLGQGSRSCVTGAALQKCAAYLIALPNGVQAMSADIPGLVETSLNLGILKLEEDALCASFSVRSCVESAKWALIDRLQALTGLAGGSAEITGDYPGWQYRAQSLLREKMTAVYRRMYGADPKVEAIHAGLECGILGSKIQDLDCVSLGPDMKDIHTTEETLSISSAARVWEYLVALLEEKD